MKSRSLIPSYRVLDLSEPQGYLCGNVLANLGADVVKIEPPQGDPGRNIGPFYQNIPHPERSLFWFSYNSGKRGITLNLETETGKELLRQLARKADVVIDSFAPGYLASLGLDYPSLAKENPRLVMVSITPFGQKGPYSEFKSCDLVNLALGGLLYICGDADRPPVRVTVEQSYLHGALQAATAVMIALYYREQSGEGQYIDVSIQEAVLVSTMVVQQFWDLERVVSKREGDKTFRGNINTRVVFRCKDGYIAWRIFTGPTGRRTKNLVDWMAEENVAGELREVKWEDIDMALVTQEEIDRWEEMFGSFFLRYSKKELYEEAVRRGIMLYTVNTAQDILEDPQLKNREVWQSIVHPELGTSIVYPGVPIKSTEVTLNIKCRAPLIGEHNEDVYCGELGLSKEQLLALKQSHII